MKNALGADDWDGQKNTNLQRDKLDGRISRYAEK
jgi:hypothetical protein